MRSSVIKLPTTVVDTADAGSNSRYLSVPRRLSTKLPEKTSISSFANIGLKKVTSPLQGLPIIDDSARLSPTYKSKHPVSPSSGLRQPIT
jgi:hypothetical protein